jgi:hypothetical protein
VPAGPRHAGQLSAQIPTGATKSQGMADTKVEVQRRRKNKKHIEHLLCLAKGKRVYRRQHLWWMQNRLVNADDL